MNTVELDSTKDATEIMVSIIYIIYANTNLGQVSDNATRMNYDEINIVLVIVKELQELFCGTLG